MGSKTLGRGESSEKNIWLYSTGNLANNLIFMMVAMYIMYYYTNILGISAMAAGAIFMVARLVDAFTDPIMGMIVDRTNTKMGKYRPFIIFGAPFLGIALVMLFTTPNLSAGGKLAYAYISYIFYSLTWTCVQIPQLALPIILSNSIARRTRVQAVFQTLGAIGAVAVQSGAILMLERFGGLDDPGAWTTVAIIFAIVSTILFILSAMSVNKLDVYNPNSSDKMKRDKITMRQRFNAVAKNRALLCVLVAFSTDMFAFQIANSMRIYFFQYNMGGRMDLMVYLGYVGLVASLIMLFVIGPFAKKMGKRIGIMVVESICIVLALVLLFAAPRQNVPLVMISLVGTTFLFSFTNLLSRAAVLDSANYVEVRDGVANNALISSTLTFMNKVAQAISAFFAGTILTFTGYNASLAQQSDGTLRTILYLMTLVPIAAYIFSVVGMYFYPLSKKGEIELEEQIRKIREEEYRLEDEARALLSTDV
ncbi:MFS transporter [Alkalibacter saccharofermentans]|uniref:Glycoside/pentoside/hexuronide:cation symporter, GPH family n=1 Tax=Alkalibacter saccharofermentans DSM 14828 TaxID=1120975 RepID=A0A1M4U4X3_9FIRM|nr:glycoside-pentoside-hexuronide (GPH):cation symporter [Alkalibacter saccharofermentans]SHE51778.1 glycoside/pentoside/hexuronide:cation symporter, GPH family [Alkalibacter saccharofermentans DSM 14828]